VRVCGTHRAGPCGVQGRKGACGSCYGSALRWSASGWDGAPPRKWPAGAR